MGLRDVIDGEKADAIAAEAARATAHGFAAGLIMSGSAALGIWITGSLAPISAAIAVGGVILGVAMYVAYFGLFSTAKVTARLEKLGLTPAPELTFGRMDRLMRRLWMFGWTFGFFEGLLLNVLAI
jgi:hypothetical protein